MRVALLALAACGGAATSAPPPVEGHAPPAVTRTTPAPKIAWGAHAFTVEGLPAVARGAEIAVVAVSGGDAGRGYPNLTLEVHDRSDRVIQKIAVLESSEYETLAPGDAPTAALTARIDAANRELASLHEVHDLIPAHALELQTPTDGGEKHLAIGDGFDVDWSTDHLHVLHHNTDKPVATVDGGPWLVKDHTPHAGGATCENPAHLDGVYHATDVNLLVVQIGYRGTDTCWEPADQLHVVTW